MACRDILRIEHKTDGIGIWHSHDSKGNFRMEKLTNFDDFDERHHNFPTPWEDEWLLRFPEPHEFCAFKDYGQMLNWITADEMKEIVNLGFKVLQLTVSECVEGEHQILFERRNVIQEIEITNWFK